MIKTRFQKYEYSKNKHKSKKLGDVSYQAFSDVCVGGVSYETRAVPPPVNE